MFLTKELNASTDEVDALKNTLADITDKDPVVLLMSPSPDGKFSWAYRSGKAMHFYSGRLAEDREPSTFALAEAGRIFVSDNRTRFERFRAALGQEEREKCFRETFHRDCRLSGASGLHEEQAWCERAYRLDGEPKAPTAYVVRVLGSRRYFAYFNFKWEAEDSYSLKSCHDLQTWAGRYIPQLFAAKDVARWVFLERDVMNEFSEAVRGFRDAFVLLEHPFSPDQFGGSLPPTPPVALSVVERPRSLLQGLIARLSSALGTSDERKIRKLRDLLRQTESGPIDLSRAPARLDRMKTIILKRLTSNIESPASSKQELVDLYLGLSRFHQNWDKLDCKNFLSPLPGDTRDTYQRLLDCIPADQLDPVISERREELKKELARSGFGDYAF